MKIKGLFFLCIFLLKFTCLTYAQNKDTLRPVILHIVDKKGVETERKWLVSKTNKPCDQGYYKSVRDKKPLLGKRETYYEICSGKWMKIEYYFWGIRTRVRINPAFEHVRWD